LARSLPDLVDWVHRARLNTGTGTQLESMGLGHFRARTNAGFEIKVYASLVAL
jgi:hypothetical protein